MTAMAALHPLILSSYLLPPHPHHLDLYPVKQGYPLHHSKFQQKKCKRHEVFVINYHSPAYIALPLLAHTGLYPMTSCFDQHTWKGSQSLYCLLLFNIGSYHALCLVTLVGGTLWEERNISPKHPGILWRVLQSTRHIGLHPYLPMFSFMSWHGIEYLMPARPEATIQ